MKKSNLLALLLLSLLSFRINQTFAVPPFMDDFDDGNDDGWVHYEPLKGLGVGGACTWSFPSGAYRLQAAAASTSPYGPARVGSYRTNVFAEFTVQMDLVAWDSDLDELFGVLGRAREPGLGTTDGYAFTYSPQGVSVTSGLFEILRITNERGTTIASFALTPTPGHTYRMVFSGLLNQLKGELFDLTNAAIPVVTLTAADSTYTQGYAAVFGYDSSSTGSNPVDLTVDNFSATPPQPKLDYTVDFANGTLTVAWPTWAASYVLEGSFELAQWFLIDFDIRQNGAFFTHTVGLEQAEFFRLVSR